MPTCFVCFFVCFWAWASFTSHKVDLSSASPYWCVFVLSSAQIVRAKFYRNRGRKNKVHPEEDSENGAAQVAGAEHGERGLPPQAMVAASSGDLEFDAYARETLVSATNDGLVNKALISALFLTFNIPAIMEPPLAVDKTGATFLIFFISAGLSIASGKNV